MLAPAPTGVAEPLSTGPAPLRPADDSRTLLDHVGVELWLTLDASPDAPARARAAVRASVVGLDRSQLGPLELMVSELVTNCVVHGATGRPGEIRVLIVVDAQTRHVSVSDHGPGFDPADALASHEPAGLGLVIVDRASTRWGTTHGGRRVWFDLPRHSAPAASPAPEPADRSAAARREASHASARTRRIAAGALIALCGVCGVIAGELVGRASPQPVGPGQPVVQQSR